MEFILIASAHFVALLSPGPDFFLVIQAALRMPLRYGFAICSGIAAANGVYLFLAVFGLEAIREQSWLVTFLRYSGSCYLIYIGILLLKAPPQLQAHRTTSSPLLRHHLGQQFLLGFLSGILNPKNMIFYLSLFTVMVSAETGLTTRCLYALWMASVVLFWDSLLVLLVQKTGFQSILDNKIFFLEKISGVMLILIGTTLPFS